MPYGRELFVVLELDGASDEDEADNVKVSDVDEDDDDDDGVTEV